MVPIKFSKYHIVILILLAIGVVVYASSVWYTQTTFINQLETVHAAERADLLTYAAIVRRNGADENIEEYIYSCTGGERRRFEHLLGRLALLERAELEELQALFSRCGTYFARQKFALVQRLHDQYQGYDALLSTLSTIDTQTAQTEQGVWHRLLELETKHAQLFNEFVSVQGDLIDNQLLLTEPEVTDEQLLERAANLQAELGTLGQEIRTTLELLESYGNAT